MKTEKHKWQYNARSYWNGWPHWDQHANCSSVWWIALLGLTQKHHWFCLEHTFHLVKRVKKAFFSTSACKWQRSSFENYRQSCNRTETCTDCNSFLSHNSTRYEHKAEFKWHMWSTSPIRHVCEEKRKTFSENENTVLMLEAIREAAACRASTGTIWTGRTGGLSRGGQTSWESKRRIEEWRG